MDRRDFLKQGGAVVAGGLLADLGIFENAASAAAKIDRRPNIVFILVDEMRFPSAFPNGVHTPEQFLRRFMPNVFELWRHGVKFDSYYSAGNACSPARATLATGLYPHQEWLLATRTAAGPALQPAFPTYGKLLKAFGYETPYIGKWHLSNPPADGSTNGYLANYGFNGFTNPDPIGTNGQGAAEDGNIADQAVQWLQRNSKVESPYCLTVSFVNPHDKQFFWAGSEGDTFEALFNGQTLKPYIKDYVSVPSEQNPPSAGYPAFPPNWESFADLTKHGKPDSQLLMRSFQELIWGGAPDDPAHTGFSLRPSPTAPQVLGTGISPIDYWQRGLDMYTHRPVRDRRDRAERHELPARSDACARGPHPGRQARHLLTLGEGHDHADRRHDEARVLRLLHPARKGGDEEQPQRSAGEAAGKQAVQPVLTDADGGSAARLAEGDGQERPSQLPDLPGRDQRVLVQATGA